MRGAPNEWLQKLSPKGLGFYGVRGIPAVSSCLKMVSSSQEEDGVVTDSKNKI
jgi:hypothetical protein